MLSMYNIDNIVAIIKHIKHRRLSEQDYIFLWKVLIKKLFFNDGMAEQFYAYVQ